MIINLINQKCNQPFFWNARSFNLHGSVIGKLKRDRVALIAGSENTVPEKTGW